MKKKWTVIGGAILILVVNALFTLGAVLAAPNDDQTAAVTTQPLHPRRFSAQTSFTTTITATNTATEVPTNVPADTPTEEPTNTPTNEPTNTPTDPPIATPTDPPTVTPTDPPTATPTDPPTATPTDPPTATLTNTPTTAPTATRTSAPTATRTSAPTATPTSAPTATRTSAPTATPTSAPTATRTTAPTATRTTAPTATRTTVPTAKPTATKSPTPTATPTNARPQVEDFEKTTDENSDLNLLTQDFAVRFEDADGDPLVKVRIVSLPANGMLRLNGTAVAQGDEISAGQLNGLVFRPADNWSGETDFDWNGSDGVLYAAAAAKVHINVIPTNDPPFIDLNGNAPGTGYAAVYNTNGGPIAIVGNELTVSDPDHDLLQTAAITIDNPQDGTAEQLLANQTGTNITVNFNSGNGVLTLSGPDTAAHFRKVLRTVQYQNTAAAPNPTTRQISFTVSDGELASNTAVATVRLFNPRIALEVEPAIQDVLNGNTAVFMVAITNTGDVELESLQLNAPKAAACADKFEELNVDWLAVGERIDFSCSRSRVTTRFDNEVTVLANDAIAGSQVSATDTAIVRVKNPNIDMLVIPAAGSGTILAGSDAVLNVYVENTGESELRNVTVTGVIRGKDTEDFQPFTACDRDIGTLPFRSLPVEYQCTLPDVQQGFIIELVVTAFNVSSGTTIEAFDIVEINVLALELEVSGVPSEILAGQPTSVQLNITVRNTGSKDVNLNSLFSKRATGNPPDPLHGELTNPNNAAVQDNTCAVTGEPLVLTAGGTFACHYTVDVTAQPPAYTVVVAATASDNQDIQVAVEAMAILIVSDLLPVEVTLSAAPSTLVAPGGTATLAVLIKNNQSSNLALQSLEDAAIGSLDQVGTCALPKTIAANESYTCEYPVIINDQEVGDQLTYAVTAMSNGVPYSDDVTINITARLHRNVHLPVVPLGYVAGEPNNSVCTAQPIAINTDIFFLPDDQSDWYRFTLTELGEVVVTLSDFTPQNGQLILYTGECTAPIFLKNNGNSKTLKVVELGMQPAGQYLIWVLTDNNFSSTRPYTLRVAVTAP